MLSFWWRTTSSYVPIGKGSFHLRKPPPPSFVLPATWGGSKSTGFGAEPDFPAGRALGGHSSRELSPRRKQRFLSPPLQRAARRVKGQCAHGPRLLRDGMSLLLPLTEGPPRPLGCPFPLVPIPPAPAPLRYRRRTQLRSRGRPASSRLCGKPSLPGGSACAERLRRGR